MRLQGSGLALRPAQQFRGAPLPFGLLFWPVDVGSARNMDYGFINSWNVYVGERSETLDNEEHGAAIRSRRWCNC